jgi:hypothetical protein
MEYFKDSFVLNYTDESWANVVTLSKVTMDYLWEEIDLANKNQVLHNSNLAGNISKSLTLNDTKELVIKNLFPEIIRHNYDFYQDKLHKDLSNLFFSGFWVNYQKKYEFNPIHSHGGTLSFVIWMQIPYDWSEESKLDIVKNSNTQYNVGNFVFVYSKDNKVQSNHITMSPEMNGKMAIFPSYFNHMVYPFYTSDDFRISISGNIEFQ